MRPLDTRIHFSDEQAMLLESATSFCRERSPSAAVRSLILAESGFDAGIWAQIAELGWLGIAVPEALGGSGLTLGHAAVIAEPMGRHLLASPFTSSQLCSQGLLAGASAAQQALWLPRLCQGMIASVALFEDEGSWNLTRPQARAERVGSQISLHGHKTLVTDAAAAELLLVSLQHDGEPALVLLPCSELPANALQRELVIDETQRCYRLALDGITLPAEALITGEAALAALQAMREAAWLLASASAAGGLAGVLDVTVDYLNSRSAFGRKIGSYQALKHGCAELLCTLERARSHVAHAASLLMDGLDAEVALRMAKVEAGDGLMQGGDRGVQFHGGFGFTYDCDAQLYLRRGLWLQAWFGDAAHHRRRLAELLFAA